MIRHKKGFERLRIVFTGLREYRCRDCDQRFRAPDRRQVDRDKAPYADKTAVAGS